MSFEEISKLHFLIWHILFGTFSMFIQNQLYGTQTVIYCMLVYWRRIDISEFIYLQFKQKLSLCDT